MLRDPVTYAEGHSGRLPARRKLIIWYSILIAPWPSLPFLDPLHSTLCSDVNEAWHSTRGPDRGSDVITAFLFGGAISLLSIK